MTREDARARAAAGLPIERARELVFALLDVSDRVPRRTTHWYLLNAFIRSAMELADREERRHGKTETEG